MFADEFDEIFGGVTRQRRFTKVRILRDEVFRRGVEICKIAAPAAGDNDLAPDLGVVLNDQRFTPAPACLGSAKKPRRAPANNDHIKFHRLIISATGATRNDRSPQKSAESTKPF